MKTLAAALRLFLVLSLLTGIIYPLVVTLAAQAAFPLQAGGSPLTVDGKVVGSSLIGQEFSRAGYFWGRRSATSGWPYNPAISSGSNLGPTNPMLIGGTDKEGRPVKGAIVERVEALEESRSSLSLPVPGDLASASGSGLDPDITPQAALYQVPRVAGHTGLKEEALRGLISRLTQDRFLGVLGEPRVNVLKLNLALDELSRRD